MEEIDIYLVHSYEDKPIQINHEIWKHGLSYTSKVISCYDITSQLQFLSITDLLCGPLLMQERPSLFRDVLCRVLLSFKVHIKVIIWALSINFSYLAIAGVSNVIIKAVIFMISMMEFNSSLPYHFSDVVIMG